jgi:hypothetical protein
MSVKELWVHPIGTVLRFNGVTFITRLRSGLFREPPDLRPACASAEWCGGRAFNNLKNLIAWSAFAGEKNPRLPDYAFRLFKFSLFRNTYYSFPDPDTAVASPREIYIPPVTYL